MRVRLSVVDTGRAAAMLLPPRRERPRKRTVTRTIPSLLLFAGLLFAGGNASAQTLVYSETFDNQTGGDLALDTVGWQAHHSSVGTAYDTSSTGTVPKIGSLSSGGGDDSGSGTANGYLFVDNAVNETRQIYWRSQPGLLDISQLVRFEVDLRNASTSEELRLAIQIGSDWYVARPSSIMETSQGTTWTDDIAIDITSLDWTRLAFEAGDGPDIAGLDPFEPGSDIVPLPTTGTINAFGFYNTGTAGNTRIDNVEVWALLTPPGAPTIDSITPGNGTLSVAFSAPSSNGGSAITNYKVSTNDGATYAALSPASTTSPILIGGLDNGTEYTVRIRAVNAIGDGAPSDSVAGTPTSDTTVPFAPTIDNITPGDGTLAIAFTAPSSDGGSAIVDYKTSTDDGSTWASAGQTTSPIVIGGLDNGTTYQVKLRAVNAMGDGAASAAIAGTPGSIIMLWDASDWSGSGNWASSIGGQTLTIGGGTPAKGSDNTLAGQAVDFVSYSGGAAGSYHINSSASHPLVGLGEFSISIVYRTTDDGGGAYLQDNYERYNAMAGYWNSDDGGGGWAVGVSKNPLEVAGGTSLGAGKVGTGSTGDTIGDGNWHTLTFVVENNDDGTFDQRMYIDGSLTGSDTGETYGGSSSAVASGAFGVGRTADAGGAFYLGDIATLRFDGTALDATTITALHVSYLGNLTAPDSPTIDSITPGDGTLSVAFTTPGSDGGSAITDYKVSTDDGATWASAGQTTSPILIGGLDNGTEYTVRIRAVNAIGDGTPSDSVTGTPTSATTVPFAPTIDNIIPGDGTLAVAFTAPSSDGGSAIIDYKTSTDDGSTWASAGQTTSPIVIGGLDNGTTYQVKLRAVNAIGDGAVSAAVAGTPAITPDAPTIDSIAPGSGKLTVVFTAPGSDGGSAITDYKYSTDDGSTWVSAGQTTSPVVISGLDNGTEYTVRILAVSAIGDGAASAAVVGTPGPIIMLWDASDWAGGTANWASQVGSEVLVTGAGSPAKGSGTLEGQTIDYVTYDGNDSHDDNNTSHPLVGLQEFSISAVFRTRDDGAGADGLDQIWRYNGLTGKELGGVGVGDWSFGVYNGGGQGRLAGGSGLAATDEGADGGAIADGQWHTMTFVVDQTSPTTFDQIVYVDGRLVSSESFTYGKTTSIAPADFAVGAVRDGQNSSGFNPFFDGDLASLRFDDIALDAATIGALHRTYLGNIQITNGTLFIIR